MIHISNLEKVTEDIVNKAIFINYKKLKGKYNFETFNENLKKFYEFTFDSYVLGVYLEDSPQNREEAYGLWVKYIDSSREANRYFRAVDSFSAYT